MTATTTPDTDDPPMATACPMQLIVGVTIEPIRHEGCRYFVSLDLTIPAPRPGDLSHCRGAHGQ